MNESIFTGCYAGSRNALNSRVDQLMQLVRGAVWDGNLISKTDRDELVKCGYVDRVEGWNFITANGVIVAINLGWLRA